MSSIVLPILVRTPEATTFLQATVADKKLSTAPDGVFSSGAASVVWSGNGAFFAAIDSTGVTIYSGKTRKQEAKLAIPGVIAVAFSPENTYLSTFQRPSKDAGNADKNLKLWDWRAGGVKLQLFQKTFSRDSWPLLQLTAQEDFVLHQVNNAINAYSPEDSQAGVARKLSLKGVGGFAVNTQADSPVLAAFVPEGKGIPGYIGLWRLLELQKGPNSPQPYCRRSFFRATSSRLLWNAKGTAVLALTASETDASNKSYYGEQKLHFLAADGSNDCLVPLPKEGPVHDVQWSPSGDHFVTVSGFMPAKTNLFNAKCKMLHDLGAGPHNMVRWNPQGRFLAVGGFGNLPGDIGFHEKQADDLCTPLGAAKAEDGVTMEWAPDGRHVMTATTAPRMRVNNGIQVFRYTGELLEEKKYPVLLEASWQPAAPGEEFEDRPASPRKGAGAAAAPSAAPIRAAGYVPPHVRSSGGASQSSSGHFSLAREDKPSSKLGGGPRSRTAVPGAESAPTAAPKKPRKRSKAKAKGEAGEADDPAEESDPPANGASTSQSSAAADLSLQGASSEAAADPAKRVRNLRKKLTQIQQLKERIKAGGLRKLDPDQEAKLASEAGIVAEIISLGERA